MCADIRERQLGERYDLSDPDQAAAWHAAGGRIKCTELVYRAVQLAAEIMLDGPPPAGE